MYNNNTLNQIYKIIDYYEPKIKITKIKLMRLDPSFLTHLIFIIIIIKLFKSLSTLKTMNSKSVLHYQVFLLTQKSLFINQEFTHSNSHNIFDQKNT